MLSCVWQTERRGQTRTIAIARIRENPKPAPLPGNSENPLSQNRNQDGRYETVKLTRRNPLLQCSTVARMQRYTPHVSFMDMRGRGRNRCAPLACSYGSYFKQIR